MLGGRLGVPGRNGGCCRHERSVAPALCHDPPHFISCTTSPGLSVWVFSSLSFFFFSSSSLPCVHAVGWRWTHAQNGSLYNLLTLWCLFAAIVGHSEWYLRALKSNQMTFFLFFKRARGCVVKGGWKDRLRLWPSEANLCHVIQCPHETNADLSAW